MCRFSDQTAERWTSPKVSFDASTVEFTTSYGLLSLCRTELNDEDERQTKRALQHTHACVALGFIGYFPLFTPLCKRDHPRIQGIFYCFIASPSRHRFSAACGSQVSISDLLASLLAALRWTPVTLPTRTEAKSKRPTNACCLCLSFQRSVHFQFRTHLRIESRNQHVLCWSQTCKLNLLRRAAQDGIENKETLPSNPTFFQPCLINTDSIISSSSRRIPILILIVVCRTISITTSRPRP